MSFSQTLKVVFYYLGVNLGHESGAFNWGFERKASNGNDFCSWNKWAVFSKASGFGSKISKLEAETLCLTYSREWHPLGESDFNCGPSTMDDGDSAIVADGRQYTLFDSPHVHPVSKNSGFSRR